MMKKRPLIIIAAVVLILGAAFSFAMRSEDSDTLKIAIVIDDWGYNLDNLELLNSIEIPITVSVLPNLRYSKDIDMLAEKNKNLEVILHMPMEPIASQLRLEEDTLLTSMKDEEIVSLLKSALESTPHAKGISNHMGSKATKDKRLVEILMKQLRKRRLYFLDSMATLNSLCAEEARNAGVKYARRDTFLDNNPKKTYIAGQIDELLKLARLRGEAIGIGHDKRATLEVLRDKVRELDRDEIEFVFVSEIVRRKR